MQVGSIGRVQSFSGYIKFLKSVTESEKVQLAKALGLKDIKDLRRRMLKPEDLGHDIISGNLLPGIHITAKGLSPKDAITTVMNIELAKIRGKLKPVHVDRFNL